MEVAAAAVGASAVSVAGQFHRLYHQGGSGGNHFAEFGSGEGKMALSLRPPCFGCGVDFGLTVWPFAVCVQPALGGIFHLSDTVVNSNMEAYLRLLPGNAVHLSQPNLLGDVQRHGIIQNSFLCQCCRPIINMLSTLL